MVKLSLAIAANERWKAEAIDGKAAFLQGTPLEREVYVEPPPEMKVEGEIWRLNKAGYGLYDSARSWYLNVAKYLGEQEWSSSLVMRPPFTTELTTNLKEL